MGILSNLITENNETFKSANSSSNTLNLPIVVIEFEGERVRGIRLDTKEEVVVELSNYQKKENSEFDRPSISKLQGDGENRVHAGGVLQFENAYQREDGVFVSRWGRVVSRKKDGNTKPVLCKTKVYFGTSSTGNTFIELRMVFPEHSMDIFSLEDFKQKALKALTPRGEGVIPLLVFKVDDGETQETFDARGQLIDIDDGYGQKRRQVNPVAQQSVDAFLDSKHGSLLQRCLDLGVAVKCCAGRVIYVGKDTKDHTLKKAKTVEFMKREFSLDKEADYHRQNLGYKDMLIGIRSDEEQKYVTHFLSINSYEDAIPEKELIK